MPVVKTIKHARLMKTYTNFYMLLLNISVSMATNVLFWILTLQTVNSSFFRFDSTYICKIGFKLKFIDHSLAFYQKIQMSLFAYS